MLHEIGLELQSALRARECPIPVIDGPAGGEVAWNNFITIEHDDGGDTFSQAKTQRGDLNKLRFVRNMGGKISIFAQSTATGANEWEHKRRAEHVLDLVLVCLYEIASTRKNGLSIKSGRFVIPADLEKSEVEAGAVYELLFTFERGVFDTKWKGGVLHESAEVGVDVGITSCTHVTLKGSESPPEEACGECG